MEMKIYERSLQALLSSAPSLVRSREAHFAYPNRRACSQARISFNPIPFVSLLSWFIWGEAGTWKTFCVLVVTVFCVSFHVINFKSMRANFAVAIYGFIAFLRC